MFYAQIYVMGHLKNHTKSHRGAVMAQFCALNDILVCKALPHLIANNDLLGTVDPRDASMHRVRMLGLFHAINQVIIHDDHRIRNIPL